MNIVLNPTLNLNFTSRKQATGKKLINRKFRNSFVINFVPPNQSMKLEILNIYFSGKKSSLSVFGVHKYKAINFDSLH